MPTTLERPATAEIPADQHERTAATSRRTLREMARAAMRALNPMPIIDFIERTGNYLFLHASEMKGLEDNTFIPRKQIPTKHTNRVRRDSLARR